MLKRMAHPDVARALSNLFWLGCERLVQIAVAIFVSGVLARYFGPDAFGKWQYANTLLLVIAPLTWICGAEILVPTILAEPAQGLGALLGSAFALRFAASAIALFGVWSALAAGWLDPLVGAMLAGLAFTLLFREPFGVVSSWLQSQTYSRPALLISMSTAIVKGAAVYALARVAMPASRFGWVWGLEAALIGALLARYYAHRHGGRLGWRVERGWLRRFASAGAVFWLGLIGMYLFLKLDRLMLERAVSYAELGRYAAAQQLNENWITLALMLAQTLAPAFVYRVAEPARLARNIGLLSALTAALMAAGALVLGLLAGPIVSRVFGPGFESAAQIFRWAVWLSVPAGVEAIGNLAVLKYQARYVVLGKWLAALAVAGAANLVLIPRLGAAGALGGLACGYVTAAAVNFAYLRYRLTH
jgi:PST family polysaccharide transporter